MAERSVATTTSNFKMLSVVGGGYIYVRVPNISAIELKYDTHTYTVYFDGGSANVKDNAEMQEVLALLKLDKAVF